MIRLSLPYPPSVNGLTFNASKGRVKTPEYRAWIEEASIAIKDTHRLGIGAYYLSICARRPDKRRRDLGNIEKAVSDLLVMHGVVEDDCLAERITLQWDAGMKEECVVLVIPAEEALAA